MAAGIWILLCVDRGLLQAHRQLPGPGRQPAGRGRRAHRPASSVLVVGGAGVAGYALGVFVSEVVATVHARWLASPGLGRPGRRPAGGAGTTAPGGPGGHRDVRSGARHPGPTVLARRKLMADVSAAFVGLALLGLLQNVDVILLGRLDHANVGPYAAISVASKALVFGALALGAYLLPEATIRWNEGGHAIRQLGVTLALPGRAGRGAAGHRRRSSRRSS